MSRIKTLSIIAAFALSFVSGNSSAKETLLLEQLREANRTANVTLPLHEEYNAKGELTHLGIALFNEQYQKVLSPYLWRGVERMMLELLLKENDKERLTWLKERNVRLFYEAISFGSQEFASFSKIMPILKNVGSLKLIEDADRYRLLIVGGADDTTVRLSFPKERELIFGTDKKEEDERQCELIQSYKGALLPVEQPKPEELILSSVPGVYHTAGQALFIDSLRTDGYYTQDAGKALTPVYSSKHPKMSVRNLLLGKVQRPELKVHVVHRQYGNQVVEWNTSLDHLLAALRSTDVFEPYAAAHYTSPKTPITGILILRNQAFGYNNMLLLSIPYGQLDSNQPVTLEGMLYTNIPEHNILTLFEERTHPQKSENNPKQKFNHTIK